MFEKLEVKKIENSQVEIIGELKADLFMSYEAKTLERLGKDFEVDGFRKGQVPESILKQKIGESKILEEMAYTAISDFYPKVIKDEKIDAIGYPRINITKLAKGNPLGFSITTAIIPEVKLPDYKKIASEANKNKEKTEVTEEDLNNLINQVKKMRAHDKWHKENPDAKGHDHKELDEKKPEDLPELTDEDVQAIGDFKTVEEFKTKMKDNLRAEKEMKANEKTRLEMIEKIADEAKIDVPDVLVQSETEKIIARMQSDIERMGLKFEDYLKNLGKDLNGIREDFKKDAEKRAKIQLIVAEIAKTEKIQLDKEKVDAEIKKIQEAYQDVDENNARAYIESIFTNEEVFKLLESF